jgi:hypothetical protein
MTFLEALNSGCLIRRTSNKNGYWWLLTIDDNTHEDYWERRDSDFNNARCIKPCWSRDDYNATDWEIFEG